MASEFVGYSCLIMTPLLIVGLCAPVCCGAPESHLSEHFCPPEMLQDVWETAASVSGSIWGRGQVCAGHVVSRAINLPPEFVCGNVYRVLHFCQASAAAQDIYKTRAEQSAAGQALQALQQAQLVAQPGYQPAPEQTATTPGDPWPAAASWTHSTSPELAMTQNSAATGFLMQFATAMKGSALS